jgi:hypothetical protein
LTRFLALPLRECRRLGYITFAEGGEGKISVTETKIPPPRGAAESRE